MGLIDRLTRRRAPEPARTAPAAYTAADDTRLRRSSTDRKARGGSAQSHLRPYTLERLRKDAQALDRDDSAARCCVDTLCDLVIGPKTAVLPASADADWNAQVRADFEAWAAHAGHDGQSSLFDLLQGCIAAACTDGDRLLIKLASGRVQSVETELLVNKNYAANSPTMVGGIELHEPGGAPKAYWIDEWSTDGSNRAHDPKPRDAAHCILTTSPRSVRKGLRRGEPLLQSMAKRLERVERIFESTDAAIEMGAFPALVWNRPAARGTLLDELRANQGADGNDSATDRDDQQAKLEPGTIWDPGEDGELGQVDVKFPQGGLDAWQLLQLRIAAADLGLPLSLVLFHITTNFHASRTEVLATWIRTVEPWQRHLELRAILPIYRWFVMRGIASGVYAMPEGWNRAKVRHRPMPVLDYEKAVKSAGTAIGLGLSTYENEVAKLGFDSSEDVFVRLAAEQARMRELGIVVQSVPGSTGSPIDAEAGSTDQTGDTA